MVSWTTAISWIRAKFGAGGAYLRWSAKYRWFLSMQQSISQLHRLSILFYSLSFFHPLSSCSPSIHWDGIFAQQDRLIFWLPNVFYGSWSDFPSRNSLKVLLAPRTNMPIIVGVGWLSCPNCERVALAFSPRKEGELSRASQCVVPKSWKWCTVATRRQKANPHPSVMK